MQGQPQEYIDVGWREWVAMPDLDLLAIKAKVDTGARTSALHAWRVEPFRDAGAPWLRFAMHPLQRNTTLSKTCLAPIIDQRYVRDSGGHREQRYVIATRMHLGPHERSIEITLTDRDTMLFRMLLGRTAMKDLRVIPTQSFLASTALSADEAVALYRAADPR